MSYMSDKAIDVMNSVKNDTPFPMKVPMETGTADVYGNTTRDIVILQPGEVWVPGTGVVKAETSADTGACLVHVWHKVQLFTTTVEECKKCGKLKDAEN